MKKVTIVRLNAIMWWVALILAVITAIWLFDLLIVTLWNFTISYLFDLPAMGQFQGIAIVLLIDILFGITKTEEMKKDLKEIKKDLVEQMEKFRNDLKRAALPEASAIKTPIPQHTNN